MTRKLTDEEKAARAAARRDADAQRKASHAEREVAAEAGRRFNARSTRESVRRSLFQDGALTLEQYRIAEARDLVGSGLTNESAEAMPIAYEGPHQVRWDPSSWHGFTRMSMSRQINNANDTYSSWSTDDYEEPGSSIDETVVADEEVFNTWQDNAFWTDPSDIYDLMSDLFGGSDLTEEGYLRVWRLPSKDP
jgi:hypothetical protein